MPCVLLRIAVFDVLHRGQHSPTIPLWSPVSLGEGCVRFNGCLARRSSGLHARRRLGWRHQSLGKLHSAQSHFRSPGQNLFFFSLVGKRKFIFFNHLALLDHLLALAFKPHLSQVAANHQKASQCNEQSEKHQADGEESVKHWVHLLVFHLENHRTRYQQIDFQHGKQLQPEKAICAASSQKCGDL